MSIEDLISGVRTPMGADLAAGLDALSYDQVVAFEPYLRLVLPYDGYVFWVKVSSLSEGAILNAMVPIELA